jgi:hypothetical protein
MSTGRSDQLHADRSCPRDTSFVNATDPARVQVLTDAGAWLLAADERGWWVEAGYD